jgi:hypothetical protein
MLLFSHQKCPLRNLRCDCDKIKLLPTLLELQFREDRNCLSNFPVELSEANNVDMLFGPNCNSHCLICPNIQ